MILKWFNLCLKNYKNLVFAIYVVKKYIKLNLSVMVVSPLEDKCTSLKEEVTGSSDNLAFQQKTWSFTKINLRLLNRTN